MTSTDSGDDPSQSFCTGPSPVNEGRVRQDGVGLGILPQPAIRLGSDRLIGLLCLMVTVVGWALNWPILRVLLREWPPLFSRGLAGVTSALVLAVIAAAFGQSLRVPRLIWPRLVAAAVTNVFAWMGFASIAMRYISVAEGALLVYTMPVWATLFAWPILGIRPTIRGFFSLLLGLSGVVLLLGSGGFTAGNEQVVGAILALASAVLFALGTVLNGGALPMPPLASTAWQLGLGCLPMILFGIIFERPTLQTLSWPGFASLAYMTVFPMGACYVTWFAAIRRLPPSTASISMLLVPLLGIISAALMLGEQLGAREAAAMALTLGGVAIALRKT